MHRSVALVIHDVAPETWVQCRQLIGLIEAVAGTVPLTLLIVPHYHGNIRMDRDLAWRAWVEERAAKGDELALHGYFHNDDGPPAGTPREWFERRVLTDGEAEFSALSAAVAQRRIANGLQLFADCGWSACGFVPPAWQLGQAAGAMLQAFALAYTTTRTQLLRIGSQDAWHSPALSLSARSELRRRCSRLYANRWCVQYRYESFVRLALHPADAHHPELLRTWVMVLQRVLGDRDVVTKQCWLQRQIAHRPQSIAVRTTPRDESNLLANHQSPITNHHSPLTFILGSCPSACRRPRSMKRFSSSAARVHGRSRASCAHGICTSLGRFILVRPFRKPHSRGALQFT